uniref:Ragulator complex protein LAMTOR2 homolog n=1 Tax=Anisakis simplex TaxID=6269 RepID=A0A0M3K2E3_ANISI
LPVSKPYSTKMSAGPGFVGIKFCPECNNMLYPKEDKENRQLLYACRNCDHKQVSENPCIYVNKLMHEIDELTQIVADVIHDPTLPKTEDHPCPSCGYREAVFFQAQSRRAEVGAVISCSIVILMIVIVVMVIMTPARGDEIVLCVYEPVVHESMDGLKKYDLELWKMHSLIASSVDHHDFITRYKNEAIVRKQFDLGLAFRESEERMLKPKALTHVLGQVNTGDAKGALLLNREGLLLAYSGYESVDSSSANATVSAALLSNIWDTFERQGIREDLNEMILECEDGVIAITKVASMLLAIKANSSVPMGLLSAKLKALADYLYTPLTVVSSKD